MYYYIRGKYITKGENYAVVDNGGIGYKIFTSLSVLERLDPGSETTLYTHLYVREDAMDLYGFPTTEELSMFLNLLSVSGVGPKAALSILSVATPEKFALAVITNDVKTITKAAGVGPKLAQRVILELKDKLKTVDAVSSADISDEDFTDERSEAASALIVLGYSQAEASKAVSLSEGGSVEELVKNALKKLMR